MHRLFGKAKPKVEAPTLEDTSGGIGKRIADSKFTTQIPCEYIGWLQVNNILLLLFFLFVLRLLFFVLQLIKKLKDLMMN
jgi:hypothetical protein